MELKKLTPAYKDYIWGGEKLKKNYGKETDMTPLAESWELSFHKDGLTKIDNGKSLAESVTKKEWGTNCDRFESFPLLIKFIDAQDNLSVQVHPSDEYAIKNENSFGKTEMWYIVEASEGAGIYLGFKEDTTTKQYEDAIKNNTLESLLNFYEVKKGEYYFIEAGTIHAICSGCVICEVQQNSNLTYRVYDYNRKDKNGNGRELHIDKALAVTNTNKFILDSKNDAVEGGKNIAKCEYFSVNHYSIKDKLVIKMTEKSFNCVTCISGSGEINGLKISQGDSYFASANNGEYTLSGDMEIIVSLVE